VSAVRRRGLPKTQRHGSMGIFRVLDHALENMGCHAVTRRVQILLEGTCGPKVIVDLSLAELKPVGPLVHDWQWRL